MLLNRYEKRNTVHQTEIPLKECEKIYTDMRVMPFIHDSTYECKEEQHVHLSRSLSMKILE